MMTEAWPKAGQKPTLRCAAVILAAGASSRMGCPKTLLPWGSTSVLGHLLKQWQGPGADPIAVVCAGRDQAMHQELDRLGVPEALRILNPAPDRGMFSSIRCAAEWGAGIPSLTNLAIVLGDQPHLRDETLQALARFDAANPDRVCQPSCHGRPRHPVIMPRVIFERLQRWVGDNLKQFLQTQSVMTCELDDPGLDFDIDRPEDYERAVERFLKRE
jgi:CTP:molybdopterin cytidylyltransferase MocA